MNKELLEKNAVISLFILVLIVFSFAQRDSKKLYLLYKTNSEGVMKKYRELPAIATYNRFVVSNT